VANGHCSHAEAVPGLEFSAAIGRPLLYEGLGEGNNITFKYTSNSEENWILEEN
jgi:hypothetical protein